MKTIFRIFSLVCLLFISGMLHAGTYPEVPGVVYCKLKPGSQLVPVVQQGVTGTEVNAFWADLIVRYDIQEVIRPFKTPDPELQKIYRIRFNPKYSSAELCQALAHTGQFLYAEPAQRYFGYQVPDDVDARQQWYFDLIRAFDAWDMGIGNNMIGVAIVDDAVKTTHPDLAPVIWTNPGEVAGNNIDDDGNGFVDDVNGYDVADSDGETSPPPSGLWQLLGLFTHGTHCAGIAGAATNNGTGIASIGNGIRIIPVKATSNSSLIPLAIDNGNEGVDYAVASGARVISMSWGGATQDSTLSNVIQAAVNSGAILVSAAGNDGNTTPNYPSALPGVICVGSVSRGDIVSSFSQRGSMIDVMAPGDSIWSTLATSANYGFQSGTSMACPLVAGLCGLMLSQNPNFDAATIENCLKSGCENIDALNPGLTGQLGAGRINARLAMECLFAVSTSPDAAPDPEAVYPNPGAGVLTISGTQGKRIEVLNALGQVQFYQEMSNQSVLSVPAEGWMSGIYLVRLSDYSGNTTVHKWVRQ